MEKKPTLNKLILFFALIGALVVGLTGLLAEIILQADSAKIWGTCLGAYMAWWIFFMPVFLVLVYAFRIDKKG